MLWCQGVQNIGLPNHKLKSAEVHRMITNHNARRPKQTDGRTDRDTDRQMNIVAIAQRFVLTNASRAKMIFMTCATERPEKSSNCRRMSL